MCIAVTQSCLTIPSFTSTCYSLLTMTCFPTSLFVRLLSTLPFFLSRFPLDTYLHLPSRPRGSHDQGRSSVFLHTSSRTSAPTTTTQWRTKSREGPLSRTWAAMRAAAVAVADKAKVKLSQSLSTRVPLPSQATHIFSTCKCAVVA